MIRKFIKEGSNQIISTTLVSVNPLVDKLVASFLIAGSISLIDYGDKIFTVFNVLLNSFLTLLLSKWSNDSLEKKFNIKKLENVMKIVFLGTLFTLVIVIVLRKTMVDIIYPTFNEEQKKLVALLLTINMAGFVFNSVSQVINRASIVLKQTKIMITTSLFRVVANIVFDILLAIKWGVVGICISSAGVHLIGLSVNYYLFKKNYTKADTLSVKLASA